jgi:hypothetical protein
MAMFNTTSVPLLVRLIAKCGFGKTQTEGLSRTCVHLVSLVIAWPTCVAELQLGSNIDITSLVVGVTTHAECLKMLRDFVNTNAEEYHGEADSLKTLLKQRLDAFQASFINIAKKSKELVAEGAKELRVTMESKQLQVVDDPTNDGLAEQLGKVHKSAAAKAFAKTRAKLTEVNANHHQAIDNLKRCVVAQEFLSGAHLDEVQENIEGFEDTIKAANIMIVKLGMTQAIFAPVPKGLTRLDMLEAANAKIEELDVSEGVPEKLGLAFAAKFAEVQGAI